MFSRKKDLQKSVEKELVKQFVQQQGDDKASPAGVFGKLSGGLKNTRNSFARGLGRILLGAKRIDDDLFEDLETQLLMADVGIHVTNKLLKNLTDQVDRHALKDASALYETLQQDLHALLLKVEQPLQIPSSDQPCVILMIGVNGAGKTTSTGKLAKYFRQQGKRVMLAAGDTFRAAAVEQLQVWGQRNQVPVIAQHTGADSASVIFDALQAAQARKMDVLIADTAGRLHTKAHLMEELKKIKRVLTKLDNTAPHEVLLVLDATTGQNAISQAELFQREIGLDGLILSKLDGTAKGGIIFALAEKFQIPIRFIGVGEAIDDLKPFNASNFLAALFSNE